MKDYEDFMVRGLPVGSGEAGFLNDE